MLCFIPFYAYSDTEMSYSWQSVCKHLTNNRENSECFHFWPSFQYQSHYIGHKFIMVTGYLSSWPPCSPSRWMPWSPSKNKILSQQGSYGLLTWTKDTVTLLSWPWIKNFKTCTFQKFPFEKWRMCGPEKDWVVADHDAWWSWSNYLKLKTEPCSILSFLACQFLFTN